MKVRKITALIPADLIDSAMKHSEQNLTDTIKEGLRLLSTHRAYQEIVKLRGKVKLQFEQKKSRRDRIV